MSKSFESALTASISDRLTKKQLIEIAHSLQDHCLVKELEEPPALELINKGVALLIKQIKYELPLLIRDVRNAGAYTRKLITF